MYKEIENIESQNVNSLGIGEGRVSPE